MREIPHGSDVDRARQDRFFGTEDRCAAMHRGAVVIVCMGVYRMIVRIDIRRLNHMARMNMLFRMHGNRSEQKDRQQGHDVDDGAEQLQGRISPDTFRFDTIIVTAPWRLHRMPEWDNPQSRKTQARLAPTCPPAFQAGLPARRIIL